MTSLIDLKTRYNKLSGARDKIREKLKAAKNKRRELKQELNDAEEASALVQLCAQQTQEQLRYQLCELPKLALSSVFDDPYDFDVKFEQRRGSVEVDFWFVRDGQPISPKDNTGLGPVDIAGMALRPALWSLQNPRSRASIWLDEPFKHLKGSEPNRRALAMLKEICNPIPERNWPGLQIVMVADERASREEILDVADKMFSFGIKDRVTVVTEIDCS
jgi:hypothetical protein